MYLRNTANAYMYIYLLAVSSKSEKVERRVKRQTDRKGGKAVIPAAVLHVNAVTGKAPIRNNSSLGTTGKPKLPPNDAYKNGS